MQEKLDQLQRPEEETGFEIHKTTFKDVIGLNEVKQIIKKKIALPIKEAEHYKRMNLGTSTGIILYGAPGVGKTLIMEAISGEHQIPMMDIKISQILTRWIGGSEKKLTKIFALAKENQPCILFFDEIDVLAVSRDKGEGGYGAALQSITGAFLKEISEAMKDKQSLLFLCGATNQPWEVDDAIKRSGRFDDVIYIRPPNFFERRRIFMLYLDAKSKDRDYIGRVEWSLISLATIGYSPADIEKVCKVAKMEVINKINKTGKVTRLTTRFIQKVLKDKNLGRNSLDESYLRMKSEYIGPQKYKKVGKEKVPIGRAPKFNKEQREVYKDMVRDVNTYIKYRTVYKAVRFIARGI